MPDAVNELEGISLSVEKADEVDGETVLSVTITNDSGMDISYGRGYKLYYRHGTGWREERVLNDAFTLAVIVLADGESHTEEYVVSRNYELHPDREYCFLMEIAEHDTDGIHEAYTHGVTFVID